MSRPYRDEHHFRIKSYDDLFAKIKQHGEIKTYGEREQDSMSFSYTKKERWWWFNNYELRVDFPVSSLYDLLEMVSQGRKDELFFEADGKSYYLERKPDNMPFYENPLYLWRVHSIPGPQGIASLSRRIGRFSDNKKPFEKVEKGQIFQPDITYNSSRATWTMNLPVQDILQKYFALHFEQSFRETYDIFDHVWEVKTHGV